MQKSGYDKALQLSAYQIVYRYVVHVVVGYGPKISVHKVAKDRNIGVESTLVR